MSEATFLPAAQPAWKRAARRAAKKLLAWRYRRFTPDSQPDTTVQVAGLRLHVMRGVFDPSMHFTSGALARYLMSKDAVPKHASVLDLGSGTGVAALAAARAGAGRVVATDINPAAVSCARLNVQAYALESTVEVREGDMFAPVHGERFDLVVCNPPYFRGVPQSMAERAYHAGPKLEWLRRFGHDLHDRLEPAGSAIISIGDAADIPAILRLLAECGWSCTQVWRRDILVEIIYLFRLTSEWERKPDA